MIFATTGTHDQPMDRLLEWLDEWAAESGEEVVVQVMRTDMVPQKVKRVSCVEPQRWRTLVRQARVVVTHAGPASIFEVQELGKTPVVVPRSAALGEHVDDHQERYAATLGPLVPTVSTREELWASLQTPPPSRDAHDRSALQRTASLAAKELTIGLARTAGIGRLARIARACCWR